MIMSKSELKEVPDDWEEMEEEEREFYINPTYEN